MVLVTSLLKSLDPELIQICAANPRFHSFIITGGMKMKLEIRIQNELHCTNSTTSTGASLDYPGARGEGSSSCVSEQISLKLRMSPKCYLIRLPFARKAQAHPEGPGLEG